MNWDAIGAIGQVLGSIAVFVTLGYLAVQVRNARQEVQRSINHGRGEGARNLLILQATNERIQNLQIKADAALGGAAEPDPFTAKLAERVGLTLDQVYVLRNLQRAWWSYRIEVIPYVDRLPAEGRGAFEEGIRASYGRPGVAQLFFETHIKPTQSSDAVHYVESVLAQSGLTIPHSL